MEENKVADATPTEEVKETPKKKEPKAEVCTRVDLTREQLSELIEEADERFAHIGGSKYEYVYQVLFPLLKEKGYTICECK